MANIHAIRSVSFVVKGIIADGVLAYITAKE